MDDGSDVARSPILWKAALFSVLPATEVPRSQTEKQKSMISERRISSREAFNH
jgi:hypothetical protein